MAMQKSDFSDGRNAAVSAALSVAKAGFIRIAANYGASIDFLPKDIAAFLAKEPGPASA